MKKLNHKLLAELRQIASSLSSACLRELLPAAILVGIATWAPQAEGHGTDALIDSFHREDGVVWPRVPSLQIIASALNIGSGGSGLATRRSIIEAYEPEVKRMMVEAHYT